MALSVECKVDHHDGVFLHNANQHKQTDHSNQREIFAKQLQSEQATHHGRRQTRQNGDGVYVAFVQHAQQNINHHQGCHEQPNLTGLRFVELGCVTAIAGDHVRGQLQFLGDLVDVTHGFTQCFAYGQVEADRHRFQLTLVVHAGGAHGTRHRCKT